MKIAWEKWFPKEKTVIDDGWDGESEEYEDTHNVVVEQHGFIAMPSELLGQKTVELYSEDDFNFWTGYSDFKITKPLLELICDTDGVEACDIISQYRWRIAVGKLFVPREVMVNINNTLIDALNGDKKNTALY